LKILKIPSHVEIFEYAENSQFQSPITERSKITRKLWILQIKKLNLKFSGQVQNQKFPMLFFILTHDERNFKKKKSKHSNMSSYLRELQNVSEKSREIGLEGGAQQEGRKK